MLDDIDPLCTAHLSKYLDSLSSLSSPNSHSSSSSSSSISTPFSSCIPPLRCRMAAQPLLAAAAAVLLLVLAAASVTHASESHKFNDGEQVPMYVNKIGPYFNLHETYHYYSLPVCRPEKIKHRVLTLGEVLDGDRMAEALYMIKFKQNLVNEQLCTVKMNAEEVEKMASAIEDLYYFEFIIDDMPVRGFVGQLDEQVLPHTHRVLLWPHLDFVIEYNGNQIVAVAVDEKTVEVELPGDMSDGKPFEVTFTYSVVWKENTGIQFSKRGLSGKSFFPGTFEIHWLSIINSAVLVLLLTGFVTTILARTLRKDFARYARDDEIDVDEGDVTEDQGWKIIHSDVFRFPPYRSLLCAILGNGVQFLTLCFSLVALAMMGVFNVHRHGSMNAALVLVYALTCGVNGYVSNLFYKQLEGQKWAWNIVVTSCVFSVPFFIMWSIVNSTAWYMGSTQALPATTIIIIMLIWLCVGFPLTVMGGIMGKNHAGAFEAPCRTKNIPREIPSAPLYRSLPIHLVVGGFLPFSAISVELYYIFATLWGREHYTLWGVLMLVLFILLAVTVCISVTLTYFLLNAEDYRWWWRSIFSSGFTGVFVFAYAVFYYRVRSNMSGTLQTVQYFCYTSLVCYIFFLTLGTVGFLSSLSFTRYIYKNLKLD
eukprot:m.147007 g.147007  ORF g.147007 m.147007 type:complete len:650 (+) comp16819_c1_seq3:798-2747(+)